MNPSKQIVNNETGATRLDSYIESVALYVSAVALIVVLNVVIFALVH